MQSIPQLIELFKHLQSSAFIFFTQIEPLILADSISDSLNSKINNTDFLNLVHDCQNSLQRLDDYINVLHPLMAKEIKRLIKNRNLLPMTVRFLMRISQSTKLLNLKGLFRL